MIEFLINDKKKILLIKIYFINKQMFNVTSKNRMKVFGIECDFMIM